MERPGKSGSRDEWIYGLNPVIEALRSTRKVKKIILSASRRDKIPEIEQASVSRSIKVEKADKLFFDRNFPKGHQGVAAIVAPRHYWDIEDLLSIPERRREIPLFLILDCVEDPRNLGAILRVADAGGVHGVILQSHRSALLGPEAIKASAGASEFMAVAMVSNIKHAMKTLRENGLTIIGAEAGAGTPLWETGLNIPIALVMGSEGRGLRKTVKEGCDCLLSIPMKGAVNSLNISVAGGVIIFEILRQRARK